MADTALALSAIAGADGADATSAHVDVPDYAAALTGEVRGVRIGVPRAFVSDGVDPQVRRAFDAALEALRGAGASFVDIELTHADCNWGPDHALPQGWRWVLASPDHEPAYLALLNCSMGPMPGVYVPPDTEALASMRTTASCPTSSRPRSDSSSRASR